MTESRPLVLGVIAVGVLDILDAFVVSGLRGVSPEIVLQAIASGLLGSESYRGGTATALLGLLLHFCLAAGVVLTYFAASGLWPSLAQRPWLYGPLYGVLVYLVMSQIVVPLSRAQLGPPSVVGVVNGVLIHLIGVGLPAALAVRAARRPAGTSLWLRTAAGIALLAAMGGASPALAQSRPQFLDPSTLPQSPGYTHVVEVPAGQRLLFISGQVPLDREGKVVGAGDFRKQAEQVFANLGRALDAAGADFADLVKITIFLRDVSRLPELREVRDRYVNPEAPPASSLVEVRGLFRDDVLLEIEAVAAVPGR